MLLAKGEVRCGRDPAPRDFGMGLGPGVRKKTRGRAWTGYISNFHSHRTPQIFLGYRKNYRGVFEIGWYEKNTRVRDTPW